MRKRSGDVAREHGDILRRLHWRAWDPPESAASRQVPDTWSGTTEDISDAEILSVLPVLIGSGSVGVVWPRLRGRFPAGSAVGAALEAAFRSQEAHNARVAEELGRVVARLREHGVEPVLIKGLAVARLYPARVVRAAGDIDLVVRDGDYAAATEILGSGQRLSFHGDRISERRVTFPPRLSHGGVDVDLHSFGNWYGADREDFFQRPEVVTIGDTSIHVPCAEDHLRALCRHFLWHGAVRPIRLCDIALMVESVGSGFDWDRCLSGTRAEREQVIVALRLAEHALGASLTGAPGIVRNYDLRPWVIAVMLRRWGDLAGRAIPQRGEVWRGPEAAYRTLASRWPDPLTAAMRTDASFDRAPRRLLTAKAFLSHFASYGREVIPAQMSTLVRRRKG